MISIVSAEFVRLVGANVVCVSAHVIKRSILRVSKPISKCGGFLSISVCFTFLLLFLHTRLESRHKIIRIEDLISVCCFLHQRERICGAETISLADCSVATKEQVFEDWIFVFEQLTRINRAASKIVACIDSGLIVVAFEQLI